MQQYKSISEKNLIKTVGYEYNKSDTSVDSNQTQDNLGLSVLVVDDMTVNQKIMQLLLEEMGCTVNIATNGDQAINFYIESTINPFNLFGNITYNIILMDLVMPVMDGYAAITKLRSNFNDLPPVIALTEDESFLKDGNFGNFGFDDYLSKPVTPQDLYKKLKFWSGAKAPTGLVYEDTSVVNNKISEKPIVNQNTFKRIQMSSHFSEFSLKEIYETIVDDLESLFTELNVAIGQNDVDSLKFSILTLKGLSGNIGASQLYATAVYIDRLIREDLYDDALKLIPLLREKCSVFKTHLQI
jgi:CheY-like chemotaxis protein